MISRCRTRLRSRLRNSIRAWTVRASRRFGTSRKSDSSRMCSVVVIRATLAYLLSWLILSTHHGWILRTASRSKPVCSSRHDPRALWRQDTRPDARNGPGNASQLCRGLWSLTKPMSTCAMSCDRLDQPWLVELEMVDVKRFMAKRSCARGARRQGERPRAQAGLSGTPQALTPAYAAIDHLPLTGSSALLERTSNHVDDRQRHQHHPASSCAASYARAGLPSVSRSGRAGQVASAARIHRHGSPPGRQGRWHLQDVVHQFHNRQESLVRWNVPRTRAQRAHSLHGQVR